MVASSTPTVAIIIRTKNEEKWIAKCLSAISAQTFNDYEIIIVDNDSTDATLVRARMHGVSKILSISEYFPGKSINIGIRNTSAPFIVLLSAHCIPSSNNWLGDLVQDIQSNPNVAGAYGKQLPMSFTSPSDKRDLLICFGDDMKLQTKDPFFHNANSIIRRSVWETHQFDEMLSNIEDRAWAHIVQQSGHKILYTSRSSVYHYHGIHQEGNITRLNGVLNVIESLDMSSDYGLLQPSDFEFCSVIPLKYSTYKQLSPDFLRITIEQSLNSKYISRVYIATDSQLVADDAISFGAECVTLRPPELSNPDISIEAVHQWHLKMLEDKLSYYPDFIVNSEITFPYRQDSLLDSMIQTLISEGSSTIVASKCEPAWIWKEDSDHAYTRVDSGDSPRDFKEKLFVAYHGLGSIFHASNVRTGTLVQDSTSLFKVSHQFSFVEIRDSISYEESTIYGKN